MVRNINLLESRRRILLNTPHIETISDTIASFETDVATKIKGCKVYFTPIQEGEGDPSPENVRLITGWDGVTVTRCGKNLIPETSDGNFWQHGWIDTNGIAVYLSRTDYFQNANNPIPIKAGTYTLSTASISWKGMCIYDKNKNKVHFKQGNVKTITLTASEDGYIAVYVINTHTNLQLEFGSEATDYEPYTATTLTIPFNSTIYGGYVDLVKGEVVEEYGCKTLNGTEGWLTQAANTTYNLKFLHALGTIPINSALNKGITEYIPEYTSNNQLNKDGILCCRFGWSDRTFYVLNATEYLDGVTDITTFKSYLAEHPLKIVYKLVTPNVYPLTPQTLKALRGMNNIWSDANGDVEVSYYTH